jgi:hypothetical protein
MKKNDEISEIEFLEKELSQKIDFYKNFQNSDANNTYFNSLNVKVFTKLEDKKRPIFQVNPAFGYAFVFLISFLVSYQFIDFSNKVTLTNSDFLFSESSTWLEEEEFLSSVLDENIELDYANYLNNEIDYSSSRFINYELNQLSDADFDEIYNNIKDKKIF